MKQVSQLNEQKKQMKIKKKNLACVYLYPTLLRNVVRMGRR